MSTQPLCHRCKLPVRRADQFTMEADGRVTVMHHSCFTEAMAEVHDYLTKTPPQETP